MWKEVPNRRCRFASVAAHARHNQTLRGSHNGPDCQCNRLYRHLPRTGSMSNDGNLPAHHQACRGAADSDRVRKHRMPWRRAAWPNPARPRTNSPAHGVPSDAVSFSCFLLNSTTYTSEPAEYPKSWVTAIRTVHKTTEPATRFFLTKKGYCQGNKLSNRKIGISAVF